MGAIGLVAVPALAEMNTEAARASVAPFYRALNAEFAKDSPELIRQSTASEWVSCRGNNVCNSRDEVIAGIGQRLKSVPDLKWEIKESWSPATRSPFAARRRARQQANSWARRIADGHFG